MTPDQRITELEIVFSHQDKIISDLNDVILDQQKTIEQIKLRLSKLEEKIENLSTSGVNDVSEEPPPPHY